MISSYPYEVYERVGACSIDQSYQQATGLDA